MKVGIVGAGIAGRLLAWRLAKRGYHITLFDKQQPNDQAACSFAAAGILSPLAELEMAEQDIFQYGSRSMTLYQQWLNELSTHVFFRKIGSLVTAHGSDKVELEHFFRLIQRKVGKKELDSNAVERISIAEKETELAHLGEGLYLPSEGQIDPIGLMEALAIELQQSTEISWVQGKEVNTVTPYSLTQEDNEDRFDWVFDCRGLGAKNDIPLRAVRGELLWLEAPDVDIKHLTRLIHPRYRIYIVPRPNNIYLVGATEIESEDYSSVSVRSSLELLSAAYSVHRGFGEARVIKSVVNCRPALPDNLPMIDTQDGLTRINGLYRHGILMAPAIVEDAVKQFEFLKAGSAKVEHAN
jgi:glycine oxidase